MPSSYPGTPDDLTREDLTHGDVADALAAVQAATLPSADAVITGARDFRGSAAYVGDYLDVIGYDPQTGEPAPNSGIRYSVDEAAAGGVFVVAHDFADYSTGNSGSETLMVAESSADDLGTTTTRFAVVLPTPGGLGDLTFYAPTPASEVVSAFNSSSAAGRVTASLLPGHDGTGIVYAGGGSQLGDGTITPHVKISGGIVTSPVTIYPTEGNETPLTLRAALGSTIGTAVLNIDHFDGSPNQAGNNYGVAHIDSDGGGAFCDERFSFSQHGHVIIDADPGNSAFQVKQEGVAVFVAGDAYAAMYVSSADPAQRTLALNSATGQTADLIEGVRSDPYGTTFRVTPDGEVHAAGGLVLTSPNGTAYRLTVADDGTLSTEPA